MNEFLERVLTDLRDRCVTNETVAEALLLPDDIWNEYQSVKILGNANLEILDNVADYAREYAEKEFPEFFGYEGL